MVLAGGAPNSARRLSKEAASVVGGGTGPQPSAGWTSPSSSAALWPAPAALLPAPSVRGKVQRLPDPGATRCGALARRMPTTTSKSVSRASLTALLAPNLMLLVYTVLEFLYWTLYDIEWFSRLEPVPVKYHGLRCTGSLDNGPPKLVPGFIINSVKWVFLKIDRGISGYCECFALNYYWVQKTTVGFVWTLSSVMRPGEWRMLPKEPVSCLPLITAAFAMTYNSFGCDEA
ncbi:hypothetical protein U9M48_032322 [Paspalum notatum var. saurae]|uniref:Uncharacterized protein n=1 Tax=Paspalum notatum var. saurae TaxID=547442 RepID=A0AAQ3X5A3_PASNO